MGYYINKLPNGKKLHPTGKVQDLLSIPVSLVIPTPGKYDQELHSGKLVCVVNNGFFEAAAYCYNKTEFKVFTYPDDRLKTWMLIPNADVLSGCAKSSQVK